MIEPDLFARQRRVQAVWDRLERSEPGISTERLIAMVADTTGEEYRDIAPLAAGGDPEVYRMKSRKRRSTHG